MRPAGYGRLWRMSRSRNFLPLAGFLVSLLAFVSYFAFFARFPVTRDIPWAAWLLFVLGLALVGAECKGNRCSSPASSTPGQAGDIARPAEFLIDPSGTVRWRDLTEDYRVRARPETVLAVFDGLAR